MADGQKTTKIMSWKIHTRCASVRSANVIRLWLCIRRSRQFSRWRKTNSPNSCFSSTRIYGVISMVFFSSFFPVTKKCPKGQRYFKHWELFFISWTVSNEWEYFETKANFQPKKTFTKSIRWDDLHVFTKHDFRLWTFNDLRMQHVRIFRLFVV